MKRIIILLILVASAFVNARASHIAGCDLSYTCIGGNDYLITLTFYRDCSGVSEPTSVTINFTSSCGNFSVTLNKLPQPPPNGQEVTPVCPGQATTCSGGSLYGLRKWVYQGQVTLTPCANWTMSYVLCCRNPSNTIQSPTNADMYIPATLNNAAAPCNSSPTFSNPPSTIICNGQQFCFNHGAIDPDGDSLVYSLVTPYDDGPGGGTPNVIYLGGYSAQQPLPSSPPVTMDPLTGDICMTPTVNLTTVLAVLVQEWRTINNVPTLIGSVLRDMQLTVVTCNNQLPTLGGINPQATSWNPLDTTYHIDMCLGDTMQFTIFPHDADSPPDNLTMSWNAGIPNGSFIVYNNGTPSPTAHFFWVPDGTFISNTPYCFTVTIADDNCPYIGQQTFSYCVTIKGIVVDLDPPGDTLLCMGENYTVVAHGDTNVVNYAWTVNGNPVTPVNDSTLSISSTTLGPGQHVIMVTVDDGGTTICPGVAFQTVTVVPMPNVNLGPDDTICEGQTYVLDAGPGAGYFWTPGGQTSQTISVTSTGVYMVAVDGGNNTRCLDYDTVYIKVLDMPVVDLGPDLCVPDPVTLDAENPGFQFIWTNSLGNVIGTGQTLTVSTTGTYTVTVAEAIGYGCDVMDAINIQVIPIPQIELGPDTTMCSHNAATFQVDGVNINLHDYGYTFEWWPFPCPSVPCGTYTVVSPMQILPDQDYTIIVTITGCPGDFVSDSMTLHVIGCAIEIPNIFTPNSDLYNDVFGIKDIQYFPNSTLVVFNRWGKKVFESGNYDCNQEGSTVSGSNCWDGENVADGVYYYILNVNYGDTGDGERFKEYHGTVTILR